MGPATAVTTSGISGTLSDPTLELHQGSTPLASNDNWKDSPQRTQIEATGIAPGNDLESAILRTVTPAPYTAIVRGKKQYDKRDTEKKREADRETAAAIKHGRG